MAPAAPPSDMQASQGLKAWSTPGLHCRPACAADQAFLREAFAQTRGQDLPSALAQQGADPALLASLLAMQFDAQRQHFARQHPGSMPWVIERHDQAVGQMWLHGGAEGLRLLDIAVLPAHRRQGVGAQCLQYLLRIADHHAWPVHLHVAMDNPVRHWYARLGFVLTDASGLHQAMTRPAIQLESRYEQA